MKQNRIGVQLGIMQLLLPLFAVLFVAVSQAQTTHAANNVTSPQMTQAQQTVAEDPRLTSRVLNGQTVYSLKNRSKPADFDLTKATDITRNVVSSTTKTIKIDMAIPDSNPNYEVLGGLVRDDRTGFYEFSYSKTDKKAHILTFDAKGNLQNQQDLVPGQVINLKGIVQYDLALAAVETLRGLASLLMLDPARLISVGARLGSAAIEELFLGGASQVSMYINNKVDEGQAYINITDVGGNDEEITFNRPYTNFLAPVPVRVTENYATGNKYDLEYVYLDPAMSYSDLLATYSRVRYDYLLANQNTTLLGNDANNSDVVPTVAPYVPNTWLAGGANSFDRSYSLINHQGGVAKVVAGDDVAKALGMGASPVAGKTWDDLGREGYTIQRAAELDGNNQPTTHKEGLIFGHSVANVIPWTVVAPGTIKTSGTITYAHKEFDWELLNWRTAEVVRLTGLLQSGNPAGFKFSVSYPADIVDPRPIADQTSATK